MNVKKYLKSQRLWVFIIAPVLIVLWFLWNDPDHGADTNVRLQTVFWSLVYVGAIYLFRKAFIRGDSAEAWDMVKNGNIAAAVWSAGVAVLAGLLFLGFCIAAHAQGPPEKSLPWLPVLQEEADRFWLDHPGYSLLAGQPEQETCITLTHRSCWNPHAGFKTHREEAFGLGQLTVTSRYDNFKAARKLDQSLAEWNEKEKYDGRRQLRAMLLMNKRVWSRLSTVKDPLQRYKMVLSAYNGGEGGMMNERRLCASIDGCDPNIWDGNVAAHSLKSKIKQRGYGKSFFMINREYSQNITGFRADHYRQYYNEL